MPVNISDSLKQNIAGLVTQARYVERVLNRAVVLDSELSSWVSLASTQIALLAFSASDDLNQEKDVENRLIKQELSLALWQIALHCMEVQEGTELLMLQAHFRMIGKHCSNVLRLLNLPEPEWDEALIMRQREDIAVALKRETGIQKVQPAGPLAAVSDVEESFEEDVFFLTLPVSAPEEDPVEKLKREVQALRDLLASLVLKRDNLLLVESRELEALYMRELGNLEAEVYREESNARYLQRKYEMMQAAVNRQEEIRKDEIEETLKKVYEAWQQAYEDYVRKAREAEDTVRRRKEKAKDTAEGIHQEGKSEKTEDHEQEGDSSEAETKKLPEGESQESEEQEPEDEIHRLKKLYRRIVKAMHPDLHPDQDERTKDLFKRAIRAYEEGDLRTLEEIAQIMTSGTTEEGQDPLSALLEEKERLLNLIMDIRHQISRILNQYPFTKKSLLHDPVRLEAEQNRLKKQLEKAKQRAQSYRLRIEELEKNGRADHQSK